jgi:hypothetical protein
VPVGRRRGLRRLVAKGRILIRMTIIVQKKIKVMTGGGGKRQVRMSTIVQKKIKVMTGGGGRRQVF